MKFPTDKFYNQINLKDVQDFYIDRFKDGGNFNFVIVGDFEFNGFIEGNSITHGTANVIVTDGFSGNIALKTAEGTANFITKNLKNSLNKLSILLSYRSLKKFKNKLDPRKYNGGIFLGLTSPVVKSHGATDYIGFYHSIKLCYDILNGNLQEQIQKNL